LFLIPTQLNSGRVQDGTSGYIFAFGRANNTPGGYQIFVDNAANNNYKFNYFKEGGSTVASKQYNITTTTDELIPAWCLWNYADETACLTGIDGVYANGVALDIDAQGGVLPDLDSSYGIGIFSANNAGPAQFSQINAGTVEVGLHDIWCLAFDTEPTAAELTAIIKEFAANPYEKLLSIP